MKFLRIPRYSIWLLPALASGQQVAGKPVLSAPASTSTPTVSAPAPSTGIGAVAANYIISPGDSLQVTVWNEANLANPETSLSLPVRPDGKISLPLINDVVAAGLTPMQLSANIAEGLKQFEKDPVVYVSVLGVASKNIFLMGEIGHVGPLAITPGMTVLQAIVTAGGLSPYANKKGIYILRGDKIIHFDYKKALKGDMQGISLVPGDTIVVR
jgi:polysaccharide export outer membrane protein